MTSWPSPTPALRYFPASGCFPQKGGVSPPHCGLGFASYHPSFLIPPPPAPPAPAHKAQRADQLMSGCAHAHHRATVVTRIPCLPPARRGIRLCGTALVCACRLGFCPACTYRNGSFVISHHPCGAQLGRQCAMRVSRTWRLVWPRLLPSQLVASAAAAC